MPDAPEAYNPLEKRHLAEAVVARLLAQPCELLPPESAFNGVGVYAIYYHGDYPTYSFLARKNVAECALPIYVGKATPKGGRKGGWGLGENPGAVLYNRLTEHAESIAATSTLRIADFRQRHLLNEDLWIPLAENMLIERFKPLWNTVVDGFGNHDQGKARRQGARSAWDTLHPGRPWAEYHQPSKIPVSDIRRKIETYSLTVVD